MPTMPQEEGFLKISGNYRNWSVYRKAVLVCDITELFITTHFAERTRTIDQMRQAARSCKQNIVEGASDSTVSTESCIKLIGIARGSLDELCEDYTDYLRQRRLEIWAADDQRTIRTRKYAMENPDPVEFVDKCRNCSAQLVANIALTLIYQLSAMLAKVLKAAEADFISNGGIKEAMGAARRRRRGY